MGEAASTQLLQLLLRELSGTSPKPVYASLLQQLTAFASGDNAIAQTSEIVDTAQVLKLIPALKSAGAEGIIEYPLNKVIL